VAFRHRDPSTHHSKAIPPVEVIPCATREKAGMFLKQGGVAVGCGSSELRRFQFWRDLVEAGKNQGQRRFPKAGS
jgi:hypothetical protein